MPSTEKRNKAFLSSFSEKWGTRKVPLYFHCTLIMHLSNYRIYVILLKVIGSMERYTRTNLTCTIFYRIQKSYSFLIPPTFSEERRDIFEFRKSNEHESCCSRLFRNICHAFCSKFLWFWLISLNAKRSNFISKHTTDRRKECTNTLRPHCFHFQLLGVNIF